METIYTRETSGRRGSGAKGRRTPSGRRRRGVALAPRECRRLLQLGICVVVFLVLFLGRGMFPERILAVREDVLSAMRADTDFRAVFGALGQSISDGVPVTKTLEGLWVDVFSSGGDEIQVEQYTKNQLATYWSERAFITSDPEAADMMLRRFGVAATVAVPQAQPEVAPQALPAPPAPEGVLPAQPQPVYQGPALPEGATMERLALGLNATAPPVVAALASGYGWREHPIAGGEKFHSGVDLAANYGSAIGAFAAGVVDYIGESPAYGQYLQIRHASGVTSFYAHCSRLCVQPGQRVVLGEKVAEVGDTGNVTGTHLHFEVKQNGTFLNPTYYLGDAQE